MTKITFPSGSPKWCREYPAEPIRYVRPCENSIVATLKCGLGDNCDCDRENEKYLKELKAYKAACAKSIREALEFVEGDRERIKQLVATLFFSGADTSAEIVRKWTPDPKVVYDVDLQVEAISEPHYDGRPNGSNTRTVARIVADKKLTCGQCGKELTLASLDKHQCDNPESEQNKKPESEGELSNQDYWFSANLKCLLGAEEALVRAGKKQAIDRKMLSNWVAKHADRLQSEPKPEASEPGERKAVDFWWVDGGFIKKGSVSICGTKWIVNDCVPLEYAELQAIALKLNQESRPEPSGRENGAEKAQRLADQREQIAQLLQLHYGAGVPNGLVHAIQKAIIDPLK